jgi:hypothetical protein
MRQVRMLIRGLRHLIEFRLLRYIPAANTVVS